MLAIVMIVGNAISAVIPWSVPRDRATRSTVPLELPETVLHAGLGEPVKRFLGDGWLYVPPGFWSDDGSYDLILHFHGVPERMEEALGEADVNAVLYTVNLGIGSGAYDDAFDAPESLDTELAKIQRALEKVAPFGAPHLRRLALTAWSAGYGSVYRILSREKDARRVDSVLLADGMHTGYLDKWRHAVDPLRMLPFTRYAERAASGDRLMALTHSSIVPLGYASTTETAHFLIDLIGMLSESVHSLEARRMVMIERADKGDLHIRGFEGDDKPAHCDHLLGMARTLFPYLHDRWKTLPEGASLAAR
jgi:hypothetical protein